MAQSGLQGDDPAYRCLQTQPRYLVRLLLRPDVNKSKVPHHKPVERRIIESLSSSVLLFDRELVLRYVNPAAEMLFQVSARHLVGQQAMDLIRCPGGQH